MKSALGALSVAFIGLAALWQGTDGFTIFTAEAARREAVRAAPRPLLDVELVDQTGARLRLSDYRGAPLLIELIYTRCPDICQSLGSAFSRIQARLDASQARAQLLSISFDPADDTLSLGAFADRYGAEVPRWRVARPAQPEGLTQFLSDVGAVIIPDDVGGFAHNVAIYVVDENGRLIAILDADDERAALAALQGDVVRSL